MFFEKTSKQSMVPGRGLILWVKFVTNLSTHMDYLRLYFSISQTDSICPVVISFSNSTLKPAITSILSKNYWGLYRDPFFQSLWGSCDCNNKYKGSTLLFPHAFKIYCGK